MSTGTSKEYLDQYRKEHKRGPNYPKFNLQAGNKDEQIFHLKLLPRLILKTDACDGPFFEFFNHYGQGPENDQTLTCLNENKDDLKHNKKKCPACAEWKKKRLLKDEITEEQYDAAKRKSARTRINWPIYNLDARKSVEILEISGVALNDVLDEFQGPDGEWSDISAIKVACCLQIKRTGSGQYCKYKYKAVFAPKWALQPEDVPNIKSSYLAPESVIERTDIENFNQIMHGSFDVESDVDTNVGTGAADPTLTTPASDLDALGSLGGENTSEASPTASQRQPNTQRQRTETVKPDDLMADLEALGK